MQACVVLPAWAILTSPCRRATQYVQWVGTNHIPDDARAKFVLAGYKYLAKKKSRFLETCHENIKKNKIENIYSRVPWKHIYLKAWRQTTKRLGKLKPRSNVGATKHALTGCFSGLLTKRITGVPMLEINLIRMHENG